MNYAVINKMDIANGPGIRVSMFVSGCNFHCKNCFNKEEQDFCYGNKYNKDKEKLIVDLVKKPFIKGLSLLGGDPLWQNADGLKRLISLVNQVNKLGKTTWIWSGFCYEDIFDLSKKDNISELRRELISSCDVYVDGLFVDELKNQNLEWRGSSNQRVIDVKKSLKELKAVLYEA